MLIFDSVKKEKLEFITKEKNVANIYVCGPTVYDDAHLGHARSSICFDLLVRTLLANGYKVNFAKNFTDIDDKIINKSKQTGKSIDEITSFYIKSYEDDMKALNVISPNHKPKATEYVNEMINFIQDLKDYTYTLEDGIYLDTSFDERYFSISHKSTDNTMTRLENGVMKKNPSDFVLWKFDNGYYDAPFGGGRPGWHTECVVMIESIFKGGLDVHCGGADLLFPHHENEACQCRLKNKKEISNYWLHNAFVNINNEKMSKSLQNCFFVKDMLGSYDNETLRFYLQSTHYRSNFNFNEEDLKASKKRLDKFYRTKQRLNLDAFDDIVINDNIKSDNEYFKECLKALNDDLNISKAISIFEEYCVDINKRLDENYGVDKKDFISFSHLLGFGFKACDEYFKNIDENLKNKIEELILKRLEAKLNKNYALADSIRDELSSMGVSIKDSKDGTTWEII